MLELLKKLFGAKSSVSESEAPYKVETVPVVETVETVVETTPFPVVDKVAPAKKTVAKSKTTTKKPTTKPKTSKKPKTK